MILRASVLMWPRRLCGLQPVDAEDSALSLSRTPHNSGLADSNRPGLARARVTGDDDRGPGSRSADPSQFVGQRRSRWPSQRQRRARKTPGSGTPFGRGNPIRYVAFDLYSVRGNRTSIRPAPHNRLGHIRTEARKMAVRRVENWWERTPGGPTRGPGWRPACPAVKKDRGINCAFRRPIPHRWDEPPHRSLP